MVPEDSAWGWEVLTIFFTINLLGHHRILQRDIRTYLKKQLKPKRGGGVPVFLRKPIATSDFHRDGSRPLSPLLDTPMKCVRIAILSSRNKVLSK